MPETPSTWTPTQKPITMTQAAIAHLRQQMAKQGHGKGLRLGVKDSGCSGLMYTVALADASGPEDAVFSVADDLMVVVDKKHLPYLQGTEIDYIKEGINYRFQFNNPNEAESCGCGESFTVSADTSHTRLD